eukprot:2646831-Pyramimonas_sp.AAC.1
MARARTCVLFVGTCKPPSYLMPIVVGILLRENANAASWVREFAFGIAFVGLENPVAQGSVNQDTVVIPAMAFPCQSFGSASTLGLLQCSSLPFPSHLSNAPFMASACWRQRSCAKHCPCSCII